MHSLFAACVISLTVTATALAGGETVSENPVGKVVKILKDMALALKDEAYTDKKVFDRIMCSSLTDVKERNDSVASLEANIKALSMSLETQTELQGRIDRELAQVNTDIAECEQGLIDGERVYRNELSAWNTNMDVLQANLKQLRSVRSLMLEKPTTEEERVDKVNGEFFGGARTTIETYQLKQSRVVGFLVQLVQTYEAKVDEANTDRVTADAEYAAMKDTKKELLDVLTLHLAKKEEEKYNVASQVSLSRTERELKQKLADEHRETVLELTRQMAAMKTEYESRFTIRTDEQTAVKDAIEVLDSDKSFFTFSSAFTSDSLIQTEHMAQQALVLKWNELLKILDGRLSPSTQAEMTALMQAHSSMSASDFTFLKAAINKMVKGLRVQKAQEITRYESCKSDIAGNSASVSEEKERLARMQAENDGLGLEISSLTDFTDEQLALQTLQSDLDTSLSDREMEHDEFLQVVADQRESRKLIQDAIDVLRRAHARKEDVDGTPKSEFFDDYELKGHRPVIDLLTNIAALTTELESNAVVGDKMANERYINFVRATSAEMQLITQDMAARQKKAFGKQAERDQLDADQTKQLDSINLRNRLIAELHTDCNLLIYKFDELQLDRDNEITSLIRAYAIIAGDTVQGRSGNWFDPPEEEKEEVPSVDWKSAGAVTAAPTTSS